MSQTLSVYWLLEKHLLTSSTESKSHVSDINENNRLVTISEKEFKTG